MYLPISIYSTDGLSAIENWYIQTNHAYGLVTKIYSYYILACDNTFFVIAFG